MENKRVTVLGGGSWGTTLAVHLANLGHSVKIWEFFQGNVDAMNLHRENRKFLPNIPIPKTIEISADLEKSLENAEIVITAVPTHAMRKTIKSAKIPQNAIVVNVSKGIENDSLLRMSEVIFENANYLKK